ncbi:MAG: iron-containing alcohol dehydrogenase [Verrucomicrobia bacterium]|nr:MAG: iron-containing alcohol dehydrogenase [Verrucomicrobiota bacterium]
MNFEFQTARQIIFGAGAANDIGPMVGSFGRRPLIVTGRDPQRGEKILARLSARGLGAVTFSVPGEPEISRVEQGTKLAQAEQCDVIIGIGGGSVLDAAKAIAAMLTNDGELLDYLEIIGRGQALQKPSAPFIAIPTTAGTGSEVTRNAVLASPEHKVKASLRSPLMLPKRALVDPELTHDLPPALTASTGLDALTQLIEPYVCLRANPMTDGLCEEGIRRAAWALPRAFANGQDKLAREGMALASLHGGLALANAGLGAVHGFAGPIGGMFPAPHGAVCAALLSHVMAANLRALRERSPDSGALERYQHIASLLTGDPHAQAEAGVKWVERLVVELHIPPLRTYGLTLAHIPDVVSKAASASSMKANPIALTPEELAQILAAAI